MKILDANMILRLFIGDDPEMAVRAISIIDQEPVILVPEVAAEVIYVMTKHYQKSRVATASALLEFLTLEHVKAGCGTVLHEGLRIYKETSLDFVDCLLAAYHVTEGYEVCTFDKKLQKLIEKMDEET